ncbi:MAG: DnaD domain protein [Leptolinea sp.]
MKTFQGFPSGKTRLIRIPAAFFTEIVPSVGDINVLKLLLHFFRALDHQDGQVRFLRMRDLSEDVTLQSGLVSTQTDKLGALLSSLEKAVEAGFILKGESKSDSDNVIFFLNTARGRDAQAALLSGRWNPGDENADHHLPTSMPDVFQLYEENIGPITPMIADMLQEAEKIYPQAIIQYAFEEAVKQNARNWKYIDAILRKWQEKGNHGKNSPDSEKDRRKYFEGDYAEFINRE